jgi:hypothetical protein
LCQRDEGVTGGGLQLPYVPVGEGAQERTDRRWGVHRGEQRPHPAVPGDVEVVNAVRAGEHPGDDRGDFARGVRPGVAGQVNSIRDGGVQADRPGQAHHRFQTGAGHEIRIVERRAHHRRIMA